MRISPESIPWHLLSIFAVSCIVLMVSSLFSGTALGEKPLYSYVDDKGQPVITDDFTRIPADRRAQATVVNQGSGHAGSRTWSIQEVDKSVRSFAGQIGGLFGGKAIEIPGMSPHQSRILTYASLIAIVCLLGMNLSRGQGIRFLSLWCLIMVGIATPVLLYTAQDGPAEIMKDKAAEIQNKQQQRLPSNP